LIWSDGAFCITLYQHFLAIALQQSWCTDVGIIHRVRAVLRAGFPSPANQGMGQREGAGEVESDEMHRSGHADFLAWHQASLILRTVRLWEQPLPAPRHGRIGILPSASIRLLQLAMALSQIPVLDLPHWRRRCKGRNRRSQCSKGLRCGGPPGAANQDTPSKKIPGGLAMVGHQLCHGLDSIGRLVSALGAVVVF